MKYLTKPARFVFALLFTAFKAVVFVLGLVAIYAWHLDLKLFDKWFLVMYRNFIEIEKAYDKDLVVYRTQYDFIMNRKSIINRH